MTTEGRRIAFKLELSRVLELLADEIYQSPLSLLRENTQNAFDAIRMRESLSGQDFVPLITVTVDSEAVVVSDNGIGMTSEEIENNFWYAGKSGKNTNAARSAGVVGTFGIGAMANFGVADELSVETESALVKERTVSSVRKSELSTDKESISVIPQTPRGEPGTTVRAVLSSENAVSIDEAREFLREFVEFVNIPVHFNEESMSGANPRSVLPSERHSWSKNLANVSLAGLVVGDIEVLGMASGELRIVMEDVQSQSGLGQAGAIVLLQGRNVIRTQRSGFGLATIALPSLYQWGGVIDLPLIRPTAGREALDASSTQLLQQIVSAVDQVVSPVAAEHPESFSNDGFLRWIVATKQFSLCGPLEVVTRPGNSAEAVQLVVERGGLRYYSGRDEGVIQTYASEEERLVVLSRRTPRRECELGYLRLNGVQEVDTRPRVKEELPIAEYGFGQSALAIRMVRILEEDYFLEAEVKFGTLSGGLPLLVTSTERPVVIFLDPDSTSVAPLLALYRDDFDAFGPFVKDFIRSTVFSRIAKLVPSSTREGSEAFLRHLRSNREWFEYEIGDKANLEDVFSELQSGRLTIAEARRRLASTDRSYVEVSRAGTAPLSSVVKELGNEVTEETVPNAFGAIPGIDRKEEETSALILTGDTPVNGYRCFLAMSDKVQRERGKFFLQPHSTEVVWGGRKVLFVFQHHAKQFGLYYDILCPGLVGASSGGGQRITATIITRTRTFIPIPDAIADQFLPKAGERKRLEVRCDVLYLVES